MSPLGKPAAALRGVGRDFADVCALHHIAGTFEAGELVVLLGPNGSGKTTLLRLLGGHLRPSRGRLELFGHDVSKEGRWTASPELRRRIAYISQHPALDPEMTVGETLRFLATLQGLAGSLRQERLAAAIATFGLADLSSRRAHQLSGGQRRRLHLAAGLLQDADLWLLDEPDAGLDEDGQRILWQELRRLADGGAAVVVVTHHGQTAAATADVAWLLRDGHLEDRGPLARLLAEHRLDHPGAETTGLPRRGSGRGHGPSTGGRGRRGR